MLVARMENEGGYRWLQALESDRIGLTPSSASHSSVMTLGKWPSLAKPLGSWDHTYRAVVRTKKEHMESALFYV